MKKLYLILLTVALVLTGCKANANPFAHGGSPPAAASDAAESKGTEVELISSGDKDGYTYDLYSDNTITITNYSEDDQSDLVIPASIDGYRTTTIGESAFHGSSTICSVILPDTVKKIGKSAFRECDYLQSIQLPDGLLSIGEYAFSTCDSLQSPTIPASVCEIGAYAFETRQEIALQVDQASPHFCVVDNVLFSKDMTRLVAYLPIEGRTGYDIPDTVETIERGAFSMSMLDIITMGKRVSYVCGDAFPYYEGLLLYPDENTSLLPYMKGIYSKDGTVLMEYISNLSPEEGEGDDIWNSMQFLVPDEVTQIADYALANENLTDIYLPENLQSIGRYAFSETQIDKIQIPDRITRIEEGVFYSCFNLKHIRFPSALTYIGDDAFCGIAVKDLVIPDSVTHIGNHAFNCEVQTLRLPRALTEMGERAFAYARLLEGGKDTPLIIPGSLKTIPAHAFGGCDHLTGVYIEDGVKAIEEYAFGSCDALTDIWIPASVTEIDSYATSGSDASITIHTPAGSAAEKYAQTHNFKCVNGN